MTEVKNWTKYCDVFGEYAKCTLSMVAGYPSALFNLIIVLSASSKNLRSTKEFRIIAALAFADFVEALATGFGGTQCAISHAFSFLEMSTLECMILPNMWMWRWSDFATAFMLLVTNMDRLLFLINPTKYIKWGTFYSTSMIVSVYIFSLFASLFAWIRPVQEKDHWQSIICRSVFDSTFYQLSKYMTGCISILSVIIYLPVIYLLHRQRRKIIEKICQSQADMQKQKQIRLTTTIVICSFKTIFLDAIPRIVGIYFANTSNESKAPCEDLHSYIFHFSKLNSMLNLPLYYWMNRTMRESIQKLLGCYRNSEATTRTCKFTSRRICA